MKTKILAGFQIYISVPLIKSNQTYSIEKVKANELYSLSISLRNTVLISQKCFEIFSQIYLLRGKMDISFLVLQQLILDYAFSNIKC